MRRIPKGQAVALLRTALDLRFDQPDDGDDAEVSLLTPGTDDLVRTDRHESSIARPVEMLQLGDSWATLGEEEPWTLEGARMDGDGALEVF
ncbi:hypothetical protein BO71DRAFT_434797 [Aspergillus ellipticus CBS 707.79]|uniref:Uncharacterized protein n=1 Tax=Aspergillus ellipticus CBS 707.79 TaxID=1448320 RepID=A0A319CVZ7_9EURO|nr:hypothetical protein BO71DRAFT_434797 [Aspergillus ellipticus CBS 707.79]